MSDLRDELARAAMEWFNSDPLSDQRETPGTWERGIADALLPLVDARVRQAYVDGYEWALAHLHDEAVQADLASIARAAPTGEAGA